MSNLLAKVEESIALVESGAAGNDQVAEALEFVSRLKQVARELDARLETATLAWIDANGPVRTGQDGPFYVAATKKQTKCRDQKAVLSALLEATGGDLDAVSEVLSSGCWKHGAAAKRLPPEVYADLFEVIETPEVKTVTRIDPKFLPAKGGAK